MLETSERDFLSNYVLILSIGDMKSLRCDFEATVLYLSTPQPVSSDIH